MEIKLVCLFRCRSCGVRVFEADIQGHLERHGIYANGDSRSYFSRCRKDTPEKPGHHHQQIYQTQGRQRKQSSTPAPAA